MGAAGSIGEDVSEMKDRLHENMKASMTNLLGSDVKDMKSHRADLELNAHANMGKIQREMLLETFHSLCKKHNTTELNKVQLRELFPMVDDDMFETLYRFFDKNGDGSVDVKEFVVTLGMLLHSNSIDDRICLAFAMFDTDGNRSLDKDEFRAMMKATLAPSMELLLQTAQGVQSFREFLQFEYAEENLNFWQEAEAFGSQHGPVNMEFGRTILNTFILQDQSLGVDAGAEGGGTGVKNSPVNIPADQRERIVAAFAKADEEAAQGAPPANAATEANAEEKADDGSGEAAAAPAAQSENWGLVPKDVFEEAKNEIYHLLEKDNFARFQKTRGSVDEMLNKFFDHVDENKSGEIDMDEFRIWAKNNPTSLNLLQGLGAGSWLALNETKMIALTKGKASEGAEGISKEDVLVDKGKHSRIAHEIMSADSDGTGQAAESANLASRIAGANTSNLRA